MWLAFRLEAKAWTRTAFQEVGTLPDLLPQGPCWMAAGLHKTFASPLRAFGRLAALGRSLNALPCGLKGSECMPRKRTLREELLIWLQGEELFRRSSPLERILTLSIFGAADGSFPQH